MNKTDWKGYTLDELRTRRLVTQVKIDIERERIVYNFTHDFRGQSTQSGFLARYVFPAIKWAEYIILMVRITKKITRMVKNLRN